MSKSTAKLTDEQRDFWKLVVIYVTDSRKGQPYIAHAFHRMIPVNAPGSGTFGVDDRWRVYCDFPKFMNFHGPMSDPKALTANVIEAASWLAHEPWHPLRDYFRRVKDLPQPVNNTAANLAHDLELNDDIKRFVTTDAQFPETGTFVSYKANLFMEEYYKQIMEDPETLEKFQSPSQASQDCEECERERQEQAQKDQSGQKDQGDQGQQDGGQQPGGQQGQQDGGNQPGGQSGQNGQPDPNATGAGQPGQGQGSGQGGQPGQGNGQGQSGHNHGGSGQGSQPGQGQGSGQGNGQGQPGGQGGQPGQGNGQGGSGSQQGQGSHAGHGHGHTCGKGSGEPGDGNGEGKRIIGCGDMGDWKLGDDEAPGLDEEEGEAVRRRVAEDVKKHEQSNPGTMPGWVKDWAGNVLAHAPIPWRTALRAQIRKGVTMKKGRLDYSMKRPNRRQPTEFLRPGMVSPIPNILVGCDTSGSNLGNLGIVVEEIGRLSQQIGVRGKDLRFFAVDVDVDKVRPVNDPRQVLKDVRLGGGTRMRPAYELAASMKGQAKPAVFILITDGEVSPDDFPDEMPTGGAGIQFVTVILTDERWGANVLENAEKRLGSWSKVIPIMVDPA